MRHSNLRTYIATFALGPGVVCALLIGAYLTYALVRDITQYENDMSDVYSQQIARQAYRALRDGDIATLENTSQLALEYPLLRSITFYDASSKEIAHAGPLHTKQAATSNFFTTDTVIFHTENTRQIIIPIKQPRFTGSIATDHDINHNLPSGWVQLEFSQSFIVLHKYRTTLIDTSIVFVVLSAAFWFVMLFGDRLTDAIKKITLNTKALSRGEAIEPRQPSGVIEIRDLDNAISAMHTALIQQQENLQNSIEQSTQDLRNTLETIEIQNIELDLARREAVQTSRIKSEFLANTSHEIRTPLNSIIGFSRLLLKTSLNAQQQDYLNNIRKSSEGLLTLINDVLDLSKIEAGKLILDYTSFNIQEILEEVLQILAPSAHDKGLELLQIIYSDVPRQLLGDPLRIKQVFTNLIGNAIKFSEEGNVVVRIAADRFDQQKALLKIEVTDHGKGLPNDNNDIFKAFTQLDSTSTRKYTGTGLGLAISQKIVRQMGGDIGYHSEPGNTTFWFTINLDVSGTASADNNQALLKNHHILVCDKEKLSRLTCSHVLTAWGAQPTLADQLDQVIPTLSRHAGSEHPIHALLLNWPVRYDEQDVQSLTAILDYCQTQRCPVMLCVTAAARTQLAQISSSVLLLQKPIAEHRLIETLCQTFNLQHFITTNQTPQYLTMAGTPPVVLAVDDNASNLKLISTMLSDIGATVLQASNGVEAIECYKANPQITVIFMDVQMPIMDGIEATKKIRYLETQTLRKTAIIALTAHALAEQRQHMLNVGMDDFLSKPASEQQLLQMLEKWADTTTHTPSQPNDDTPHATFISPFYGECVDRNLALQACGNKPEAAAEMLTLLLQTLEEERLAITQAIETKQLAQAKELVHKLHGGSCYCGVTQLKNCCDAMETLIKKDMTEYLVDVLPHFHAAVNALLDWRRENDPITYFQ